MVKIFSYWRDLFDWNRLEEFNTNKDGILWLKLKSILRKEYIADFISFSGIEVTSKTLNAQFEDLYNRLSAKKSKRIIVDQFIQSTVSLSEIKDFPIS